MCCVASRANTTLFSYWEPLAEKFENSGSAAFQIFNCDNRRRFGLISTCCCQPSSSETILKYRLLIWNILRELNRAKAAKVQSGICSEDRLVLLSSNSSRSEENHRHSDNYKNKARNWTIKWEKNDFALLQGRTSGMRIQSRLRSVVAVATAPPRHRHHSSMLSAVKANVVDAFRVCKLRFSINSVTNSTKDVLPHRRRPSTQYCLVIEPMLLRVLLWFPFSLSANRGTSAAMSYIVATKVKLKTSEATTSPTTTMKTAKMAKLLLLYGSEEYRIISYRMCESRSDCTLLIVECYKRHISSWDGGE